MRSSKAPPRRASRRQGTRFVHFSVALPAPSTELYDQAIANGWFVDAGSTEEACPHHTAPAAEVAAEPSYSPFVVDVDTTSHDAVPFPHTNGSRTSSWKAGRRRTHASS